MTKEIVNHAIKALLYEVVTEPKPGLVDPSNNGSHSDMDAFTFISSSLALEDYFIEAAKLGEQFQEADLTVLFQNLRKAGILAERQMFRATQGVNTHKGAIFALGIFVCAKSYADKNNLNVFSVIKQMCAGLVKRDLKQIQHYTTVGATIYKQYGIAGAREMAESGYQVVEQIALPFLIRATGTTNQRLLDTLMKIAAEIPDTTFIKRSGGIDQLPWLKQAMQRYFELGGSKSPEGMQYLHELNDIFVAHNYTIGGCADILIVTVFMALEMEKLV